MFFIGCSGCGCTLPAAADPSDRPSPSTGEGLLLPETVCSTVVTIGYGVKQNGKQKADYRKPTLCYHRTAFFGALPAGLRTGFAMGNVVGVFFAFGSARFAGFGTNLHVRLHKLRTTGCQSTTEGTDIGTVAAEFDAGGQVMALAVFVAHFQQGRYAALAGFSTVKAGIRVIVFVLHRFHKSLILVSDHRWSANLTHHDTFRFYRIPGLCISCSL